MLQSLKKTILTLFQRLLIWKASKLQYGSKVTAVLLNGWILPTGGVASGMVCPAACAAGLFLEGDKKHKANYMVGNIYSEFQKSIRILWLNIKTESGPRVVTSNFFVNSENMRIKICQKNSMNYKKKFNHGKTAWITYFYQSALFFFLLTFAIWYYHAI